MKPTRAHRLTLALEADDLGELASQLINIAHRAERGELSSGVSGSPSSGYVYELLSNPEQTHDKYFAEVQDYLAELKVSADSATERKS